MRPVLDVRSQDLLTFHSKESKSRDFFSFKVGRIEVSVTPKLVVSADVVKNVEYNAAGLKTRVEFGNDTTTGYEYYPEYPETHDWTPTN